MIIKVIFGHMKEEYDGQYSPEALDVIDEFAHDENPDWIEDRLSIHNNEKRFGSVKVVNVEVQAALIMDILYPNVNSKVNGKVVGDGGFNKES